MTFKSINECIIADSSFLWSYYGRWRVHCPIQVSSVQASGEDDQMRVCDEFNEYFEKIRKILKYVSWRINGLEILLA